MYTIQSITQNINKLTPSEKQTLFQLISEHSDLLDKIIPGLPLINHATGKQALVHPLAEHYDAWLNAKT